MSGELPTCVDHYTLLVCAHHLSETGTELGIIKPYYGEPCTSSTRPYCLVSVTILTTMVCVLCMYWGWHCVIPYQMEFPASRQELTVFSASLSRKGLIVLRFLNWGQADLLFELTWSFMLISLLNITPNLWTVLVGTMSLPLMLRDINLPSLLFSSNEYELCFIIIEFNHIWYHPLFLLQPCIFGFCWLLHYWV